MKSSSAYSVAVSEEVRQLLSKLSVDEPSRARRLALLLLSLEKSPRPVGSRGLRPEGQAPANDDRVWSYGEFTILYRVDDATRVVEVAVVDHTP